MPEDTIQNCIFCKIINKELPANIVYEDEKVLAFLDIRPISKGHTLIIPKKHYRWVWDMTEEEIEKCFKISQKIAKAQQKAFFEQAIHSKVVGDEVHHAHIWIYPNPENFKNKEENYNFEENLREIIKNL